MEYYPPNYVPYAQTIPLQQRRVYVPRATNLSWRDWALLITAMVSIGSLVTSTIFLVKNANNTAEIITIQKQQLALLMTTTTTAAPTTAPPLDTVTIQEPLTVTLDQDPVHTVNEPTTNRTGIYRFLDVNGDGTGTKEALGDYSGMAQEIFYIQPPVNTTFVLSRMIVQIEDNGGFDSGLYGNSITLTNGIVVRVSDDMSVLTALTDTIPILTNSDWAAYCYDVALSEYGTGNNYAHVRWTFARSGQPLILRGNYNERLEVVLNDDFSDLVGHRFQVQGYSFEGTFEK